MTFTPLFFLPRSWRIWAYHQAMAEHLLDTPFGALFWVADRVGVEFWYKGDTVIWTWPWRRKGLAPFISLSFSGNGDFGDARYWTLKELDDAWEDCLSAFGRLEESMKAANESGRRVTESIDKLIAEIELFNQPIKDGAIGRVI
jgi:hypothetical protein